MNLNKFTNLYQLSKTLRFELIPVGKTLDFIKEKGLLSQDEHRAESYKKMKKIIDEYHKQFIDDSLKKVQLKKENVGTKDSLGEYFLYYNLSQQDEMRKKHLPEVQKNLRKQIVKSFKDNEQFDRLSKKELIREDLLTIVDPEGKKLTEEFRDFTTYFTGFNENRKNMYSDEEKSSAIAYRLIHENLPRFIENISVFEKIKLTPIRNEFSKILKDLGGVIQVISIEEMFQLGYFNETLTQTDIDRYNQLLGGYTSEDGKIKIQGLNEYVNLYNQRVKSEGERLPKLKPLYKQILSDRTTASFIIEQYKSDQDVLESILKFYMTIQKNLLLPKEDKNHTLKEILQSLQEYNLNGIYLKNDTTLANISKKLFDDWSIISKAIEKDFENNTPKTARESEEKYQEKKEKYFKSFDSFSIEYLNKCIAALGLDGSKTIESYFYSLGKRNDDKDLFQVIEDHYKGIKDLLQSPYPEEKSLSQQKKDIENIKTFLDAFKELQWFIKPLLGKGDEGDKDNNFYGEFMIAWDVLDENLTPLYDKVRNYMTRKPYSTEKFKLNFENSTLLDGWDVNKESDNTGVLFRKNGFYYLGIIDKRHNKILTKHFNETENSYEKIDYKLLPGANKMLPKVFFSRSRIDEFSPSQQLIENYKNETHKKGSAFNLSHCHQLIDFFKSSIRKHEDWKNFDFDFSDTNSYEDLRGFYREVEQQGYKISFRNVPELHINQLVDEGKLYLFKIYNKDFSPYSKGTPNLHTLYWKMLFDPENLKNVVYKLNGQAEVFYRKSSIKDENKIVHKANELIKNKNDQNEKRASTFKYDLIKDKRFTIDKFQFHVPITMNFKAKGVNNINLDVNQFIKENYNDIYIIGIDRGERNLLYLTLIDSHGKIKEQFSLNEIVNVYKNVERRTNYHDLLDKREGNRKEARKNWQTIDTIKELKEGYLSQVVHKIATLMIKYNAIVVLEDLNMGFMRGRQRVEKSVYQKFEKMLIEKLNYLVDKQKTVSEWGGTMHAYQLTNEFESFQKMGKQSGFLFYVPAWNTSKMDPVTGFVNLFDTRYENIEKSKTFFRKFDNICFNAEKNYFEFSFDYNNFTNRAEGTKTIWTVCTYGNRIENFRNSEQNNEWHSREFNLTEEFKSLFEKYGIDLRSNIKEAIEGQSEKAFFYNEGKDKDNKQKGLLQLFRFALQIRNSKTRSDIDYLISPVANEKGEFYDSSFEKSKGTDSDGRWISQLPVEADANGAYNIARKGLWVVEQIRGAEDLKKIKLAISNKEWLIFVQNKV